MGFGPSRRALFLLTLMLGAVVPAATSAQSLRFGMGGGLATLRGDDFDGMEAGFTVGGDLLFQAPNGLQAGIGLDYSRFGIEKEEVDLTQIDVMGVLRYLLAGDGARFFLGAKAGFSRFGMELLGYDASANGFSAGPSVGFLFPLGSLGMEIGVDGMSVSSGEFQADGLHFNDPDQGGGGEVVPDSDVSGFRLLGRVELSVPIKH